MAVAVLDASAIVALLFKERGYDVVLKVVRTGSVTTATGLAEALHAAWRKGHRLSAGDIADHLGELGLAVEPLEMEDGIEMARILRLASAASARRPEIGRISLGDAACLAVGGRLGLPVVVSDGTWEVIGSGVKVVPFR